MTKFFILAAIIVLHALGLIASIFVACWLSGNHSVSDGAVLLFAMFLTSQIFFSGYAVRQAVRRYMRRY